MLIWIASHARQGKRGYRFFSSKRAQLQTGYRKSRKTFSLVASTGTARGVSTWKTAPVLVRAHYQWTVALIHLQMVKQCVEITTIKLSFGGRLSKVELPMVLNFDCLHQILVA